MPTEVISPEVECLKLKAALNENHRLAQKAAGDAIQRAVLAGELLLRWKELLPHGKFEVFVGSHFDGSKRTAQTYMTAAKGLSAIPNRQSSALLATEDTMAGLLKRIKKDDSGRSARGRRIPAGESASSFIGERDTVTSGSSVQPGAVTTAASGEASDQISDGEPGGDLATSSTHGPVSSDPVTGETADSSGEDERTEAQGQDAQETGSRPPRSGKDKPGTGTCPCCAGKKWQKDEQGFTCAKCHHPWGEVADIQVHEQQDASEILRSKTVKTAEALMRCFDDLQLLVPKAGTHKQAIELCKKLLTSAKVWK